MARASLLQIIIVTIAVVILSLLYFFYPAGSVRFYPTCIFHEMTGWYCPGCGSQRAISALLHGNIINAASYNILLVVSLPFILYSAVAFTWNAFNDTKLTQGIFHSPVFIKVVLCVVVLFGILRNIPSPPYNWLAP